MRERVADKLLFVMAVAPILFCNRALAQALIENQFAELAQITQFLNLVGRIATRHALILGGRFKPMQTARPLAATPLPLSVLR